MIESISQPILEFEGGIKAFRQTWRGIDIRALIDLRNDLLLTIIACLTPDEPQPIETVDQVQDIALVRGIVPIKELDRLLASLRTGSLTLGSYSVSTQEFENYRFSSLDRPRDEDLDRGWPEFKNFPQLSLWAWGKRNLEAITAPRDLWAAARVQGFFGGFPELCLERLNFDVGGGKVLRAKIFAPVFIFINSWVEDDVVHFEIRFHSTLDANDLMLAYRIQDSRGNRVVSGQKSPAELQLVTNDDWSSLVGSIPLTRESARVELRAFSKAYMSGAEVVAAEFLEVPLPEGQQNPRWNVLQSLIDNTRVWTKQRALIKPEDILQQWLGLAAQRPDQTDFERGINCLLWLSGLPSLYVGPAEGVDLAVFVTDRRNLAALLSCTTSPDLQAKFNQVDPIIRTAVRLK